MKNDEQYSTRAVFSLIMIDELQSGQPVGRINNAYFTDDISFCGFFQLIFTLNEICSALGSPQCEFELRSFSTAGKKKNRITKEEWIAREAAFRQTESCFYRHCGKRSRLCTFAVEIVYRRYGSLQGKLTFVGKTCCFRSSLELEYLLSERLGILPQLPELPPCCIPSESVLSNNSPQALSQSI